MDILSLRDGFGADFENGVRTGRRGFGHLFGAVFHRFDAAGKPVLTRCLVPGMLEASVSVF